MSRIVVKVGGAVAARGGERGRSRWRGEHEVCVVHGAGPQISAEMERARPRRSSSSAAAA